MVAILVRPAIHTSGLKYLSPKNPFPSELLQHQPGLLIWLSNITIMLLSPRFETTAYIYIRTSFYSSLERVYKIIFWKEKITWNAWISVRFKNDGLFARIPPMDSIRFRAWNDCRTVRDAKELFVTMKVAQVSLTQLKPREVMVLEITSTGCLLKPSANIGSRCDGQLTHANLTRFPDPSTIHRELVDNCELATEMYRLSIKGRRRKDFMFSLSVVNCRKNTRNW